ncbi:MAG: Mfa1 fimbrilin C-terminal domain-containing protein [Alistipes sp.]|nr:Mfa1 fimbrilin C-terminal domain-containing protein [Alistipes sp.]
MKKFFICALAAMAFVACSENNENGKEPNQKGELEQSYVSITLAADDMNTRAADGVYEEGTAAERAVNSAHVFFFKDGVAFPVAFDGTTTTNSGACNWLEITLTGSTSNMPNVSDVKKAVLVIQNYKGEYPNQMVAVLNWTPDKNSYTLSELQTKISTLGNDANGYVMSNSVYANEKNQVVDAVALTINNIAKTAQEALDNPVTIYVERVAAKVVYSADNGGKFQIGKNVDNTEIYAHIKNFELYNDYEESWLLKRIDPTWSGIGFAWNDADWFRSYWAQSLGKEFTNNTFDWNNDNTALNGVNYLGENTRAWTEADDVRTKVIVKAQLGDVNGNPVEIVSWYGKEYIGEGNLLKVVANTLKGLYFWGDGSNFTGAAPEDLKCTNRLPDAENAYEVYFQLSTTAAAKSWYKYEDGKYTAIAVDALNTELAKVQPALVYKSGMTYYWLDIKHLGNTGSLTEYGIVRNHVYKVNISDVKGFGTPIYDPEEDFIVPDKPEDVVSYVSAQINILSWRVVANDYEI